MPKSLQPIIPKENSWGKPIPFCRRKNIRKKWYRSALDHLLPPLPDEDWRVLSGLIQGSLYWSAPVRRKMGSIHTHDGGDNNSIHTHNHNTNTNTTTPNELPSPKYLTPKFLSRGPQKTLSFRSYINGRPHKITRRYMTRIWERLSYMIPRISFYEEQNSGKLKQYTEWGCSKWRKRFSVNVNHQRVGDIFFGVDERGKVVRS